MKRVIKSSLASYNRKSSERACFTPNDVAELLARIEELQGCEISYTEPHDGFVEFIIGKARYNVAQSDKELVPV